MNYPFVSVIIPVYNDKGSLKACLEALDKQTYPQNLYEIIIVDNGGNNGIENITRQYKKSVLAKEPIAGSYAARNKGISIAKGEVIAFTDADCIPFDNWIETGVKNILCAPNCGLVAGQIKMIQQSESHSLNMIELYYLCFPEFDVEYFMREYRSGCTANLFTSKDVLNKVGVFDSSLNSGGDFEWCRRVYKRHYKQVYSEDVRVWHPARLSFRQFYEKIARVTGGRFMLFKHKKSSLRPGIFKLRPLFILLKTDKLSNSGQRIKVFFVYLFVICVKCFELLRLSLGRHPKR